MNVSTTTRFSTRKAGSGRSVRALLADAIDRFGDAGPLANGIGGTRDSITSGLSKADRDVVARSADLRRYLKRILIRVGDKMKERVIAKQRALDLIDTTLAIRAWSVVTSSDDGRFADRVGVTNSAPYVTFMHPKGTPKSRTFVKTDIPAIAAVAKAELKAELAAFKRSPVFQQAMKAALLRGIR